MFRVAVARSNRKGTAAFEKDIVQNGGKSAIQINITGVGGAEISQPTPQSNIIDGDSGEILQD